MTETKRNDSRSGVALIIVLGILGVLMVLAVAFAISMRTESAASSHALRIVKTRAMVHAALARALADIDGDLAAYDTAAYPAQWSQHAQVPIGGLPSSGVDLYTGQVTNLLPIGIYLAAAKLPSPAGGGRIESPVVPQWSTVPGGRVAYLIVNLSGLLDAQHVGDVDTPRGPGSSLAEIDVSQLSDAPDMATLVMEREAAEFETLFEMAQYGGFSNGPPRNWTDYSRYRSGVDGVLPAAVNGEEDEVKAAFLRSMALAEDTVQADILYVNLQDYIDGDNIPGGGLADGTQGPYVEAVPMVNEIYATNWMTITAGGDIANALLLVSLEISFPFVNPTNGSFAITYDIRPVGLPPGMAVDPLAGPLPRTVTLSPDPETYVPLTEVFSVTGTNIPAGITYGLEIDAEIAQGDPVDRIPTVSLSMSFPPLLPGQTGNAADGHDVIDPRVNWDASHWANLAPYTYEPTLGSINASAVRFMAANGPNIDTDDTQRDTSMYVANRALKSIGELGYLFAPGGATPYVYLFNPDGTPMTGAAGPWLWRTVRLYDHGAGEWDRVLDYFSLSAVATNATGEGMLKGLVNPNSEVNEALAALFFNMGRNDRYYGEAGATSNSWANALNLAASIQAHTYNTPFDWPSDLGRQACASAIFGAQGTSSGTELQKEAFFRNCASLFHTRNNVYCILMAAQAATDPTTFSSATEQRALAVVWRDPVANADGRHLAFVRWFTWVEK